MSMSVLGVLPMNRYYRNLVERQRRRKQKREELAAQMKAKLKSSINDLIAYFPGIQRVILFGSLQRGNFRPDSDIDIYIEWVNAEEYYMIKSILEADLDRSVDLHTQHDGKNFTSKIKSRGEVIYERRD